MLSLPSSVKIYLATKPTDMRKSHDGLCALVQQEIAVDVFSGHLFVFVSKRGNRIKILAWDHGGFVLWYKRLEEGQFILPPLPEDQKTVLLERAQLMMILEGIDLREARRTRRWQPGRRMG